NKKSQYS
ncbi:hypothetical protein VCHENC02_1479B, partial [Vibrio harveyi]